MPTHLLTNFLRDESGSNAVEYALLAAMIAVTIVASVTLLGERVKGLYENISSKFPTG